MMTDNDDLLRLGRRGQLTANVTFLMLKGAGYALAFLLAVWLVLAVMAAVGRALPEDSRATPDPAPRAFIDMTDRIAEERAAPPAPAAEDPPAADESPAAEDSPAEDAAPASE